MVTKIDDNQCPNEDVGLGDNRIKDEWFRGGGMNVPRMRRPEEQPPPNTAGLMMEVWASVASWFLKPDGINPMSLAPCTNVAANMMNNNSSSNNNNPSRNNNCAISNELHHLPLAPTICTPIRCTVPGCNCECFTPGKLHIRYCEGCSHGWVPHALDKLGFRHIFSQNPVEPVQPNVAFDIASLVLYGCQALPIRLKILLDRLFSVLQKEEVTQILRGFGWNHEDYARGYILQEAHGAVLDRWNICSPEEEPLVLQQFLRFGETRTITQQLLLHGIGDIRQLPRIDADFKKIVEKSLSKSCFPKQEEMKYKQPQNVQNTHHKSRSHLSPTNNSSLSQIQHMASKFPAPPVPLHPTSSSHHQPSHSISPHQKHGPLNFVKLPQTGLTCTPIASSNGPVGSPPDSNNHFNNGNPSPLNKLQNMQPFDFRKIASSALSSSKSSPERRRFSDHSETSQTGLNLCVTSPSILLPPPPPPIPQSVTSNFPIVAPSMKSPSIDFTSSITGSSEFGGSEDGDDEDENSQSVLNLSKDAINIKMPRHRHTHSRKASTPMKRQWGSSSLPLNLGTQLINPATGKKRVQCNVCLKTFCDKGALKIHFSAVHLREMHKCTVEGCNMMFSSRRSRNRHSANPNPKLHSPHLRRKISPHDGRSSQAHPILIPPLQPGLNPLSFGPFPLLPHHDLRHQMTTLDLKHNLDFGHMQHEGNPRMYDNMSSDNNDEYLDDDDDEEGIVVDGGGVDDDENDSETNSADKSINAKRMKLSDSDMEEDDGISNTDSNESSTILSDTQISKEDNDVSSPKNVVHKRKSQNPTRCTLRVMLSDEDTCEDIAIFTESNAINLRKQNEQWEPVKDTGLKMIKEEGGHIDEDSQNFQNEFEKYEECENNNVEIKREDQSYEKEECLNLSKNSRYEIQKSNHEEDSRNSENKALEPELIRSKSATPETLERCSGNTDAKLDDFSEVDRRNDKYEVMNFSEDVTSPARSHESYGSCGSFDSDENQIYGHFEDGTFISSEDVPLDKDNPKKCTACGKLFQNHFGVKTHFQNVHLKLMHRCVIEGCNAAFPSKRSRDRHSSNLNLHRKLLSTSDSLGPFLSESPPFSTHPDFFSRLHTEGHVGINEDLINNHQSLMIPSLGILPSFAGMNPFQSHMPLINGRSQSASPISPSRSPRQFVYNIEEDMPSSNQDNKFHCRFCTKPFAETILLKEHYEKYHLNEMFRCKVSGCLQVFSSRTKRNHHSETKHHHTKELPNS